MNQISQKAIIYGDVQMGHDVRIDDFCILTGKIKLGNFIHLGCYSFLSGGEGIEIGDFCGFSPRFSVFTASDDYSGESLTNPTVPDRFKSNIQRGPVKIGRHVLIGANCVVMPGVEIGEGVAVGAFSFVNRSLDPWGIYCGVPARWIRHRKRDLLDLEQQLERYRKDQE